MLPSFLVGALAVPMRADLDLSPERVGLAVLGFFLVSAVSYATLGRRVEGWGAARATGLGAAIALVCAVAIGTATSASVVVLALVVGGSGNAVSQLAANVRITAVVPAARRGAALGTKQGAVPLATTLAGAALPLLGDRVSWRAAYIVLPLALLAALALTTWRSRGPSRPAPVAGAAIPRLLSSRPARLWTLALAAALGTAGTNTLAIFFVDATVSRGVASLGAAGTLLALGSGAGAVTRIVLGHRADRRGGRHLVAVATLLASSAIGFAMLGSGGPAPLYLAAAAVAFVTSWGWNGLMSLAVIATNPSAPAQATAITQTGVSVGSALGPALAGPLVGAGHVRTVWFACAAAAAAAAVLTRWTRSGMVRDLAAGPPG